MESRQEQETEKPNDKIKKLEVHTLRRRRTTEGLVRRRTERYTEGIRDGNTNTRKNPGTIHNWSAQQHGQKQDWQGIEQRIKMKKVRNRQRNLQSPRIWKDSKREPPTRTCKREQHGLAIRNVQYEWRYDVTESFKKESGYPKQKMDRRGSQDKWIWIEKNLVAARRKTKRGQQPENNPQSRI